MHYSRTISNCALVKNDPLYSEVRWTSSSKRSRKILLFKRNTPGVEPGDEVCTSRASTLRSSEIRRYRMRKLAVDSFIMTAKAAERKEIAPIGQHPFL